jgi:ABC-type dipeptide/oligopeptide/nickel transport system permease component
VLGYIRRSLLSAIPTVIVVVTVVFLMTRLTRGDPVRAILGESGGTPEQIALLREQLGLDKPLPLQYLDYWAHLLRGDLGRSLINDHSVWEWIVAYFPFTLQLAIVALCIGVAVGIPLGMIAAVRQNSLLDHASMVLALVGMSTPAFFLAILLIMLFAVNWQILPITGVGQPDDPLDMVSHLVLPGLALGLYESALIARMCRSSMLDVLQQDFLRTARAKGLRERVVMVRHALKNAMLPVLAIIAVDLGQLLGGTVILETVFSRPGLGTLLVQGILQRDYPVVQGTIAFFVVLVILVNILFDLVYAYVDPRIRYS